MKVLKYLLQQRLRSVVDFYARLDRTTEVHEDRRNTIIRNHNVPWARGESQVTRLRTEHTQASDLGGRTERAPSY